MNHHRRAYVYCISFFVLYDWNSIHPVKHRACHDDDHDDHDDNS
ncbi:MAG: hypothetical protein PHQ26_00210 [Bacteroidales bacterium]|nr:hypothetical protein [Bacteroidales bacterium]MDD4769887.1 hypothetical protein [Bacteroidales bacterium]